MQNKRLCQLGALEFLWSEWTNKPVKKVEPKNQISKLIDIESFWQEIEKTEYTFEKKSICHSTIGTYKADKGKIWFKAEGEEWRVGADNFCEITALVISSDLWRLYIADKGRRYIFAMSICPDGSLKDKYILGSLHLTADCRIMGALDLCIDSGDRVYAATELGIQSMTSFGIVDAIIPLPEDLPCEGVVFRENYIYAKSRKKYFKRKFKRYSKIV